MNGPFALTMLGAHGRAVCRVHAALILCTAGVSAACTEQAPALDFSEATAGCEIQIDKIAEATGDEMDMSSLALLTADRIFLRRNFAVYDLAVFERRRGLFGERSHFVRTIGTAGQGPGEFRTIQTVHILPDGRFALFDSRNLRLTYIAGDYGVESTHQLPVVAFQTLPMPDGGYLVSGSMIDGDRFGSPIVRLDKDGNVVQYYGEDATEKGHERLRGTMTPRWIAYHQRHGLVSVKLTVEYVIERWNEDGTPGKTHRPVVDWYTWPASTMALSVKVDPLARRRIISEVSSSTRKVACGSWHR